MLTKTNKQRTTKELIESIDKKFNNNRLDYEPYIRHIRFPKYKGLQENTHVQFNFPLTVLVGKNGTNKTSLLQALYGAPGNNSVGEYWFSTDVDKIESGSSIDRHCLIYGYQHLKAEKVVETLKTRIKDSENKDYWEPSRPLKRYGMKDSQRGDLQNQGSEFKTRWEQINKNVVFCDFKEYVSAYDLFFYHFRFEKTVKQNRKHDFIRDRSKHLSDVIANNRDSFLYYDKEQIESNELLSNEVCEEVSQIMGEDYSEIRIITHTLYTKGSHYEPAKTIWIKKNNQNYSEAFAGSGESRIILLVNDVLSAADRSLLLIDEPEISLHPEAIREFKIFLLKEVLKRNHQVVITTHSPQMIRYLPAKAIKLMNYEEDGSIQVKENIPYQDAFYNIGEKIKSKIKIFVEDKLAKEIIERYIELFYVNSSFVKKNVSIDFVLGGSSTIINEYIANSAAQKQTETFYILDGDMNKFPFNNKKISREMIKGEKVVADNISKQNNSKLGVIIKEITGRNVTFYPSSNKNNRKNEISELKREFIRYWENNVLFLNSTTPENAILESKNPCKENDDINGKAYYENLTKDIFKSEKIGTDDIFYTQKKDLNNLEKDCPLFVHLDKVLSPIFEENDI